MCQITSVTEENYREILNVNDEVIYRISKSYFEIVKILGIIKGDVAPKDYFYCSVSLLLLAWNIHNT